MPRPGRPADVRALQARLRRARDATPRRCAPAPRPAARCAATTRCFAPAGAADVDGAVLGPQALRAALLRRRTDGPAAARQPRRRPAPRSGAGAAARAAGRARPGTCCGRARTRATAAPARRRSTRATTAGSCPAKRRVLLRPSRRSDPSRENARSSRTWPQRSSEQAHRCRSGARYRLAGAARRRRAAGRSAASGWSTNGLGGYASGTVAGADHAALPRRC